MRKIELYLDDVLWHAPQLRARSERTTVSNLLRRAARERYGTRPDKRREVMQAFIGIRENWPEFRNPETYLRRLRRGSRMERLDHS